MAAADHAPAVRVEGLRKAFRGRPAVDGLDLTVMPGEVFGLVGPDGAGKTTAFRLMCGVLQPDGGEVHVAGFDVRREPEEVKRRIGYLSQAFSQYDDLTVWENLRFVAALHSLPDGAWRSRADELLDASRMAPFRHRLAGKLSGGMRQKLALSCALLHTPQVVFLDEPTTGVDPVSRRDFWAILYDLPRHGVTIVVSTPYMDEAERCRRVAFLSAGRATAVGSPQELKAGVQGVLLVAVVDQPRAAHAALAGRPDLLDCALFGDRVHVLARDAEVGLRTVRGALARAGIAAASVDVADMGLEDVFVFMAGAEGRGR